MSFLLVRMHWALECYIFILNYFTDNKLFFVYFTVSSLSKLVRHLDVSSGEVGIESVYVRFEFTCVTVAAPSHSYRFVLIDCNAVICPTGDMYIAARSTWLRDIANYLGKIL